MFSFLLPIVCVYSYSVLSVIGGNVTVPKCCPVDKYFNGSRCVKGDPKPPWGSDNWTGFDFIPSDLTCPPNERVIFTSDEFTVSKQGALYFPEEDPVLITDLNLDNVLFCVDWMIMDDLEPGVSLARCIEDEETEIPIIYCIGMIISIPFLLVTLIIYVILRPYHSIDGHILLRHVFPIFLSYVTLVIVQVFSDYLSLVQCIFLGFAVQFFFLATFFWLNVMCIDIYWAFSGIKLRGTASERDRKKLLAYSFYAWGMPLIILAVTVGVDYSDSIPSSSIFKPNMGKDRCFFKGRTATWTYFYGPMAVILFSNLILFSITAYRIWRHRRETAQSFHRGDSRRHDGNESERFNLYLKLFLVMGINWISELISFMFGKDVPQYLWYITDITNTLQGVFIFLIFVWKKRVRKLLWEKLCGGKQSQLRSSTMTTSTALNSSTR
ncbi:G-protein coupled receptor Mth2-like isoform X2 [Cimex lectularius]|uniref:G-protein coupled receptors family 2 profile 2 domain-containing protein n=1 Tax=Cimex lectularius TaxID=79782 RepID=A0A8I6RXM8_CIMLE|nr:G-protein coupled receptor Mth2-like isoform X2 [Cimex lectularius]